MRGVYSGYKLAIFKNIIVKSACINKGCIGHNVKCSLKSFPMEMAMKEKNCLYIDESC